MKQVMIDKFGGPEVLRVRERPTPDPGPGQVRVRLTSIGLNHAEVMGRRGDYKISTGEPPFTPGLEGGGVIDAVGDQVDPARIDQRVILSPEAPRRAASVSQTMQGPGKSKSDGDAVGDGAGDGVGETASDPSPGGTYRSHYLVPQSAALPAPDAVPDDQLGALWLAYLTAWGCLVWKQQLQPGRVVALPAASSSVALAAAQIVKHLGGTAVGLTTSPAKIDTLRQSDFARYDHVLLTHDQGRIRPWRDEIKDVTQGRGVDVFFDPVGAGRYLEMEIKALALGGTIWIYGLLGKPDTVDVSPLLRKQGAIRGWMLTELIGAGEEAWRPGCAAILEGFETGIYRQHLARTFPLDDVQRAHREMEKGEHIGKLALVP